MWQAKRYTCPVRLEMLKAHSGVHKRCLPARHHGCRSYLVLLVLQCTTWLGKLWISWFLKIWVSYQMIVSKLWAHFFWTHLLSYCRKLVERLPVDCNLEDILSGREVSRWFANTEWINLMYLACTLQHDSSSITLLDSRAFLTLVRMVGHRKSCALTFRRTPWGTVGRRGAPVAVHPSPCARPMATCQETCCLRRGGIVQIDG